MSFDWGAQAASLQLPADWRIKGAKSMETAKNFFQLNQQSGIPRKRTIAWNIIPWYIGSGSRIRLANSDDIDVGVPLSRERILIVLREVADYFIMSGTDVQHMSRNHAA